MVHTERNRGMKTSERMDDQWNSKKNKIETKPNEITKE